MIRKDAPKIRKPVSKDGEADNEHEETHPTVDAVTMEPNVVKRSPYEMICLSVGVFYLFLVFAGSLYVALMFGS